MALYILKDKVSILVLVSPQTHSEPYHVLVLHSHTISL